MSKIFQFEKAHSTVIYKVEESSLYVQSIDAYGFQRELSVARRHKSPGAWESHAYQHPGRRGVQGVSEAVARAFIERFLDMCADYPDLLFNAAFWRADEAQTAANVQPCNAGFVRLHEALLRGEALSQKLL